MVEQGFTRNNSLLLSLLTAAFVFGEVAHFLFGTVSREMAQDIHFGRLKCYEEDDHDAGGDYVEDNPCDDYEEQDECEAAADPAGDNATYCYWDYSGQGIEYQGRTWEKKKTPTTSLVLATNSKKKKKLVTLCENIRSRMPLQR